MCGWRAVEPELPTAFEDAIDDRVGEVLSVEHAAPVLDSLLVVKIIAPCRTCRSLTTGKRTVAASVP